MELEDALRKSGEDTARLSERLRREAIDGTPSTATAKKLLETSRVHIECLMGVGMHGEAVATGAATLATIIVCRINPEDMAGMYLSYLQGLYLMSLPLASEPSGDEETQNHLITVAMQLGALSDISYNGLDGDNVCPAPIRQQAAQIDAMFKEAPAEFWEFDGKKIVPQSALDILSDCLARLKAVGFVD